MKYFVVVPPYLHRLMPLVILGLGTSLSILALQETQQADAQRVETALALQAEWRVGDFTTKLRDAAVPGENLAVFFATQKFVDTEGFHFFAREALRGRPTTRLAWAPWVSDENRDGFETSGRLQNNRQDFALFEQGADGTARPAAQRPFYAPVLLEERFKLQNSILGYDYMAEPVRRQAIEQARDRGIAIASAAATPIFAKDTGPALNFFWPVYRNGVAPESVEARRDSFLGVVVAGLRSPELMAYALRDTPAPFDTLSLFVGSDSYGADATPLTLYNYATQAVEIGTNPLGPPPQGGLRLVRGFEALGQSWMLVFDFPASVLDGLRSSTGIFYLVAGLIITLGLAVYVAVEQHGRSTVERIVAERTRALRHASDQMKAMIEASPDAIVCLDADQSVILWNRSAERLFGYEDEEVIGRPYPLVLPDERDQFESRIERLRRGEILRNLDSRRPRKDGTILETSSSAAAFYGTNGELLGTIFVIKDNTDRNQIQAQLRQAQKMEAVGQLTGGLAHDFNNLLGIVLGNLDFMTERFAEGSEERELADAATRAATRGAELTRQLLAFSRRQPLAPKRVDPVMVLEGITHLLRRTLGENIRLRLKVDKDAWPLLIDVSQLESAILNLAVNARDAMPEGGSLTIEATNVLLDDTAPERNPEAAPGDYVVIAVSDTGSGMSEEVVAHVFEPFFTTKGARGTGLGLSMVHGFVKQSGGHTRIYSEIGRGTTIRIYLPRVEVDEIEALSSINGAAAVSGNETILVVEDNAGLRDITVRQLQSFGYRTVPAASGDQALEILRGGIAVDLLFTDVVMPGKLDGKALAMASRRLRSSLKILFTSGFTGTAAATVMRDDFGSYLLSKPYRKDELARRVRAILDMTEIWSG